MRLGGGWGFDNYQARQHTPCNLCVAVITMEAVTYSALRSPCQEGTCPWTALSPAAAEKDPTLDAPDSGF